MDENITVIQGTMRLGMGEKFDQAKLRDLPAGSYAPLPKGSHTSTCTKAKRSSSYTVLVHTTLTT
jgi:hypothetical protein